MKTTSGKLGIFGACVLLAVAGCGGEIADDPAAPEGPVDPADPDVVPMGFYVRTVGAASCNVNDAFQNGDRTFLVRKGTGTNISLPLPITMPKGSLPRQDFDLQTESLDWERKDDPSCPGGVILVTLTRTELTRSRVAFTYREAPTGCMTDACEVDFAFDLTERVCTPASDPSCVPEEKSIVLDSGPMHRLTQEVSCVCGPP